MTPTKNCRRKKNKKRLRSAVNCYIIAVFHGMPSSSSSSSWAKRHLFLVVRQFHIKTGLVIPLLPPTLKVSEKMKGKFPLGTASNAFAGPSERPKICIMRGVQGNREKNSPSLTPLFKRFQGASRWLNFRKYKIPRTVCESIIREIKPAT